MKKALTEYKKEHFSLNRRTFIGSLSCSIGLTILGNTGLSAFASHKSEGSNDKKLGIALVGLGGYSGGQLAPALQETQHCYLAGIVTGSPEKIPKWKSKYKIPDDNIYNYENFDSIKNNPSIDIVYVVLPVSMHAEYTIRAAQAGKHVICEKPMAITVKDCDSMISACKDADRMLSIGYRLHFEPHNKEMMRLGQEKVFGKVEKLRADNGSNGTGGWRLDKELAGGGPLMDLGVYCIQGIRYTTGMEPIAVTAVEGPKTDPETFKEVEQSLTWRMEFADNVVAECKTSYSEAMNLLRAEAENGWFELSPAYPYSGINGKTSKGELKFKEVNQQALQMDDFALAIKNNRPSPVPGEMGRQDIKIIEAIYEAMRSGKRITL